MIPRGNRLRTPFSLLGTSPLDTTAEMRDILAPTPELDETFRPISLGAATRTYENAHSLLFTQIPRCNRPRLMTLKR